MFCVSRKHWPHVDLHICAPFSWTQRMLRSLSRGAIWNFIKTNMTPMTWTSDYGAQRACLRGLDASGSKRFEPSYSSVIFCPCIVMWLSKMSQCPLCVECDCLRYDSPVDVTNIWEEYW